MFVNPSIYPFLFLLMHFLLDDVRFLYRYFYGAYDIEVEKHDESHAGRVASRFAFHNTMGMFCGRPRGAPNRAFRRRF